jgi:hypothetical protein
MLRWPPLLRPFLRPVRRRSRRRRACRHPAPRATASASERDARRYEPRVRYAGSDSTASIRSGRVFAKTTFEARATTREIVPRKRIRRSANRGRLGSQEWQRATVINLNDYETLCLGRKMTVAGDPATTPARPIKIAVARLARPLLLRASKMHSRFQRCFC